MGARLDGDRCQEPPGTGLIQVPTADALTKKVAAIIPRPADRTDKGASTPSLALATLIMESPMTDEVAADNPSSAWAETASPKRRLEEAGFGAVGGREALADVAPLAVLARAFHHAEADQERIAVSERINTRLVVLHAIRLEG
jgi:hypothetical protein